MINRLKNYLSSRSLAEQYVTSADECLSVGNVHAGLRNLIHALRYLITANNNLQSLAFHVKPKRRKP